MRRTRAVLGVILLSASFVTCAGNLSDEPSWLRIKPLLFGAGGCSAPVNKGAHLRDLGRMKLRVEDQFAEPGEPVLAQLNVMHPQFSGMASNVTMEPHFVRQVDVYYGEERIMRAQVDFTISENPMFRFYFQPQGEADLRAEIVDSTDLRVEQVLQLPPETLSARWAAPAQRHITSLPASAERVSRSTRGTARLWMDTRGSGFSSRSSAGASSVSGSSGWAWRPARNCASAVGMSAARSAPGTVPLCPMSLSSVTAMSPNMLKPPTLLSNRTSMSRAYSI